MLGLACWEKQDGHIDQGWEEQDGHIDQGEIDIGAQLCYSVWDLSLVGGASHT